jgi:hypothetical protein
MSDKVYTVEEVLANFETAKQRIKPAVLTDVPDNGNLITAYVQRNKLAPTADNFYKAVNSLYESLRWVVKPTKLLLLEGNKKPVAVTNALKDEAARAEVVRAGEQHDKDAAERAKLVEQCESIIASYLPYTKSGRVDFREQEDAKKKWSANLTIAKTKGLPHLRAYTKELIQVRAKRYADREAASERI